MPAPETLPLQPGDWAALAAYLPQYTNFAAAAQTPAAATRTYIAGSQIQYPAAGRIRLGTRYKWRFNMTKTAAGVAASTIDIAFGTAGTIADTARVSFTKPAGTAAVDEAFCEIEAVVQGPIGASCIVSGELWLVHNGNTVGHAVIPAVVVNALSAGFDITLPTFVGLCLTSGAADAITIQQVTTEAFNL